MSDGNVTSFDLADEKCGKVELHDIFYVTSSKKYFHEVSDIQKLLTLTLTIDILQQSTLKA
ncbi:hypothetical protein H5410_005901 [Solanum commersonii]|uniref:Uncharacterized protein n=1 Tax=Solanum commersonii TaxID=4109 RepID=A0A9J6A8R9_SOLCO|nr:hypothetical protein H5410_005901 [Solanum commersonii]